MAGKYSLQKYLYDDFRCRQLTEEMTALTNDFAGCRWALKRLTEVLTEFEERRSRMKVYENQPQNRGGDDDE